MELLIPIMECRLCRCTSSLEVVTRRLKAGEPPMNNPHGSRHKCPCHHTPPTVLNVMVRGIQAPEGA